MKILIYLLQVSASMAVFALVYQIFLRKLTFSTINRWYLLASLILSLSIPAIQLEIIREQPVIAAPVIQISGSHESEISENSLRGNTDKNDAGNGAFNNNILKWEQPALWLYAFISFLFLIRLLLILLKIALKAKEGVDVNGIRLVKPWGNFTNCSFFNLIFIEVEKLDTAELEQILVHEKEHIKRFHSVDKLFIEILKTFMWFNPAVYYYRRVINEVHEFEVDKSISSKWDKKEYCDLLLKLSQPSAFWLMNSFSVNPLKKRIQMIFTKQSTTMRKLLYAFLLPVSAVLIWGFSVDVIIAKVPEPKSHALIKQNYSEARNKVENVSDISDTKETDKYVIAEVIKPKKKQDEFRKTSINGDSIKNIHFSAGDSIRIDKTQHIIDLYGNSQLKYKNISITAGHIRIDSAKKVISASGKAKMKQDSISIIADTILFNWHSKKGKIISFDNKF